MSLKKTRNADGTKSINGFRITDDLGKGSFAEVKLCDVGGAHFALKVFRKGKLRRQRQFLNHGGGMKVRTNLDKVYGEIAMLKRICHPCCVQLHAVFDDDERDGKVYLVLEYCANGASMEWDERGCSFFSPQTKALIPEAHAREFVVSVAQALAYLHREANVGHRDVKPQNILVGVGGAKLADFGVAIELGPNGMVRGTDGTFSFYCPEMCAQAYDGHDCRRADVWALGVSAWAFIFGSVPFYAEDAATLFNRIAEGCLPSLPVEPVASMELKEFLLTLMSCDPAMRPLAWELDAIAWCCAASDSA